MATLTSQLIVALVDRVTGPSRAIAASVDRLTQAQALNTQRMNAARMQMLDAAVVAYALARAVASPIRSAMDLESAMADVAKVTSFDPAGLKEFERGLRKMAVDEIPLAVTELTALAAAAAQAGVPETDLTEFTRMTAKAAVAWEVTGAEAGEALAKIRTALNMSNPDLFKYADAINHLSDRTAASAPDMVDFSRRVAAQGEFFGFSATETLAFGAAMVSAGAESEVAATSFRNMGRALTRGAAASKAQRRAYKALGLDAAGVAKAMQKDAVGTTMAVIEQIGKLPAHMQASTMSDLFGDEARALAPLIGRLDILRQALGYVSDETEYGGSVSREFEARSKTTANALQLLRNQMNELGISIGSALLPALNDAMETLGPIITRMAEWADANPALTRAIVGTAAALVGLRVAAIAAKFSLLWMKGGVLSAAILGMRGLGAAVNAVAMPLMARRAAIAAAALLKQRQAAYTSALAMQALASKGALAGLSMQQATKNVAAAGRAMAEASAGLKAANAGLGSIGIAGRAVAFVPAMLSPLVELLAGIATAIAAVSAPVWGVIAVVVAAVAGLALAIYNYWVPISEFVSGFVSVIWDALSGVVSAIGSFGAEIASAVGSWVVDKAVDFAEWLGFDRATVEAAVNGAVESVKSAGSMIVAAVKAIPGQIGNWLGDIFTMNEYSAEAEAGFRSAGERAGQALIDAIGSAVNDVTAIGAQMMAAGTTLAQSLWDGVQVKVGEMVAWFAGLPGRIIAAIGRIDIGSLIKWPTPPAWLSRLWGGGGTASEASAPPVEKRAAGGPVRPGEPYLVGERGPELVTFGQSGIVHDALKTARMMRNAALASTMALPAAAMPAMPQAPRIDLAGLHAAASAAPATAGGRTMNISDGAVQITIHASPGQSPEQIAAAVERSLSARLGALSRGAFSDGAN